MKPIVSHFFTVINLSVIITALGSCSKKVSREKSTSVPGGNSRLRIMKPLLNPVLTIRNGGCRICPTTGASRRPSAKTTLPRQADEPFPEVSDGTGKPSTLIPDRKENFSTWNSTEYTATVSEVWINGHYLGKRHYGYSSFRDELTPWLHFGNQENVVAVRVDNSQQPNSRWYSGSGIYRNVWLVSTGPVAVDHWGTFVTTPEVNEHSARIHIETRIRNTTGKPETVTLETSVYDRNNRRVSMVSTNGINLTDTVTVVQQELTEEEPQLWSVDNPALYRVVSNIRKKTSSQRI